MLLLVNDSSTESCSGCMSPVSAEVTNVPSPYSNVLC